MIIDWAIFFYALNYYQNIELTWSTLPLLLGFIAVIFGVNSAQFAVAHEIMHKPGIRRIIGIF